MEWDQKIIKLATELYNLLSKTNKLISTAESCTGGMLAAYITAIPGASKIFKSAIVTYSNMSKIELLKVPENTLSFYGAVSAECATAMADGCKTITGSDITLSVTGIAGPTGSSKNKPIGLVYFGLNNNNITQSYKKNFNGDRHQIRNQSCKYAIELILDII